MITRSFDEKNINLWSKALKTDLSKQIWRNVIRFKPNHSVLHDNILQAIWHGPKFLDERGGNYSFDKIMSGGKLLPYRYEDVDSSVLEGIIMEYERMRNEKV